MTVASFEDALRLTSAVRLEHGLIVLAACLPISVAVSSAGVVLVIVLFLRDWGLGRITLEPTSLDALIVLWILWTVLSSITSLDPVESFKDLRSQGYWAIYFITVTAVVRGVSVRRLQDLWIAAAVVTAVYGVLQTTVGMDLLGRGGGKATGFYSNHLAFGHLMAMSLGLVLARLGRDVPGSRFGRWALPGALVVLAAGLAASFARGPWLALLFVVLGWMLWERRLALAVGGIVLVVAFQVLWIGTQPEGLEGFYRSFATIDPDAAQSVERDRVSSNTWRMTMWREGLRLVPTRPVLGTGPGTIGELSPDFRTPFRNFGVAHLHSSYFEILVTRGIVGLALLVAFLLAAARLLARAGGWVGNGMERAALFGGLAGILVHAVHGHTYFTVGKGLIQPGFLFLLGMAVGVVRRSGADGPVARLSRQMLTWAMVTVAIAVLAVETLEPGLWAAGAASVCGLDLLRRAARGTVTLPLLSLGLAFAFVVVASVILLLPTAGGWIAVGRVVEAAAIPFVIVYGSLRLAERRS